MSMEHPNPEYQKQLIEGRIKPLEGEDAEKVEKGNEVLQKARTISATKKAVNFIIEKLKRDTGRKNLEDLEKDERFRLKKREKEI